ncbi:MAG: hypothetical protein ACYDDP_05980 [Acidithiobacillus sp.]
MNTTLPDHGEDLHTRINQIRVMVRLMTMDELYSRLGNSDLAYALEVIENQLEDACNCSGALVEKLTRKA